jgi:single stranded DNA-binding protein
VNEPHISLAGYLGATPKLRLSPTGIPVTSLRIATTQSRKVGEEWQDGETLWFGVTCWKGLAENVVLSLRKGDRVTVSGKLAQRTWKAEDGSDKVDLDIEAQTVGVDLRRFAVDIQKPVRTHASEDVWAKSPNVDRLTGELPDGPLEEERYLVDGEERAA